MICGKTSAGDTQVEKRCWKENGGNTVLFFMRRNSERNRKVVFDGMLSVDKTGIVDPETGTIRLNARVGGPENLRDNAVQLLEEQSKTVLDSSGSPGYNAGEEGLFQDAVGAGGGGTDFYVGPNGKVLPSQYKDWIGTNMQDKLLNAAENPQLRNAIKQLYRGNSFIGDGGTADIIKFEKETGIAAGKGGSHIQKGLDMTKYLMNKILTKNLSLTDRKLAEKLLNDLNSALRR